MIELEQLPPLPAELPDGNGQDPHATATPAAQVLVGLARITTLPLAPVTAEELVRRAIASARNDPGYCLVWCRELAEIDPLWPSAALAAQNAVGRKFDMAPMPGRFAYWTGGSTRCNPRCGHIAITFGDGDGGPGNLVKTTDGNGLGFTAVRTIQEINDWSTLQWAGHADNCNGRKVAREEDMPLNDQDLERIAKIARREADAAIAEATPAIVKALLDTELPDGDSVRKSIRQAGDTKAIAKAVAKALSEHTAPK